VTVKIDQDPDPHGLDIKLDRINADVIADPQHCIEEGRTLKKAHNCCKLIEQLFFNTQRFCIVLYELYFL
jgi:hypothetical protein